MEKIMKILTSLYIPVDLKKELEKEAQQKGLSYNSYVIMILKTRKK